MSYGLDLSEVRFETDNRGNRLKATIPYTMFSALTEFRIQARRAQTGSIEVSARSGQYKGGSLQAAQRPTPDDTAPLAASDSDGQDGTRPPPANISHGSRADAQAQRLRRARAELTRTA